MTKDSKTANSSKLVHTHYEFSFELVLENETTRPLFVKHCHGELNGELVDFCTQVDKYRKSPTKDMAYEIYNTFVKEQSKKEINIPQILRYQVEGNVSDLQAQVDFVSSSVGEEAAAAEKLEHARRIFDECYDQVRMSLYNSFGRFKRSKEFISFVSKSTDAFLRTIGKHKSEIQSVELTMENFTTPLILPSDVAFAQELTQDYYYWKPIYHNKNLNMTYYNGYSSKHKFYNDDVFKLTGFMVVVKNEFNVPASALQTVRALFCERYRTKALGMNKMQMLEYIKCGSTSGSDSATTPSSSKNTSRYPTSIFQCKIFVGGLFQQRDLVCAITAFHDKPTKSYFVIIRSCNHPNAVVTSGSLFGHYYFVYRLSDLGSECKLQMIALANSHGMMEAQKPGLMSHLVLQMGAPELCKKQAKHVLLMLKDSNQTFDDDTNVMQMIQDYDKNLQSVPPSPSFSVVLDSLVA